MNKFVRRKNPFIFPVHFPASPVFLCQEVHNRGFALYKSLTAGSPSVDYIIKANSLETFDFL